MLINLHSHLEGRVRPETALELAPGLGIPAPDKGWEDAIHLDGPADLTTYLEKVASTYPFFSGHESLARISCEAVEDAAAAGEDYLELRFGPATHVSDDFTLDQVIAAVCEGVAEGTRRSGMNAGVVVAALRLHDADLNEAVARAAARYAGNGVVGFDLAGDEQLYPDLLPYVGAFAIARSAGLGLTCHAAEAGPAQAALDAVDLFGVTRIGHGAHIVDDQGVLNELVQRGITIEVCPTSNLYTGAITSLSQHPARRFKEASLPLVVGDDNPRQTGSPLKAEFQVLSSQLGFSDADLEEIYRTSLKAGFMEPRVRSELESKWRA